MHLVEGERRQAHRRGLCDVLLNLTRGSILVGVAPLGKNGRLQPPTANRDVVERDTFDRASTRPCPTGCHTTHESRCRTTAATA